MGDTATVDFITIAEARERLSVSKPRMAQMLKGGVLAWEPNPLDRRSKVVRRADVEALAKRSGRGPASVKAAQRQRREPATDKKTPAP